MDRDYLQIALELVGSVAVGFLVAALIMYLMGFDPVEGLYLITVGGLSDPDYLLSRSSLIMMTGLAFAIPALASAFNIGGEGQMYVGGLVALIVSLYVRDPVTPLLAGSVAGGLVGFLIGALRAYRDVNEVITAIMLNWTIYYLVIYLITTHFYNPLAPYRSVSVPESAQLGLIKVQGAEFHLSFPLSVIVAAGVYMLVYHTRLGYEIRVSGYSARSARYAGIDPKRTFTYSMTLGGLFGGLSGAINVIGFTHYIDQLLTSMYGMGFDGIGVALMGRNNPLGIVLSSIFFSMLLLGGQRMQVSMNVPKELTDALSGVIIISLAMPYAYRMLISYLRIRRVGRNDK